jgi:hypothetical protein
MMAQQAAWVRAEVLRVMVARLDEEAQSIARAQNGVFIEF